MLPFLGNYSILFKGMKYDILHLAFVSLLTFTILRYTLFHVRLIKPSKWHGMYNASLNVKTIIACPGE